MTELEIIDETIEYYKTHNRGLDDSGRCRYRTETGDFCAVGRCFNKKARFDYECGIVSYSINYGLENHLKPKYRGHNLTFWVLLQQFHDDNNNWIKTSTGNELSESGLLTLKDLKERWENTN